MNAVVAVVAIVATADVAQRLAQLRRWSRAERATASGALVVSAALLGALATPLIDGLDISHPTIQIAAGLLVALWSFWQFFTWDVEPAPAAVAKGLVPGFFPLLLTPPVGVLLVAVGANAGVATAVAGALLTAAALLAPPARFGRRALRRATASLALVCGVALMVDGVLAV